MLSFRQILLTSRWRPDALRARLNSDVRLLKLRRWSIRVPWTGTRCIACLRDTVLSEEHVIPEALGGRLSAIFLCRECNSSLGHRAEAAARSDPTVRLLANSLAAEIPALAQTLSEGLSYVGHGPGGRVAGYVKDGEFVVRATTNPDDSLIQPTPDARRSIDTILRRQGYDAPFRAEAIRALDEAPENTRVEIAPGLRVVKWEVTKLELGLDGPLIDPLVPLKMAFEFLACHLGTAVYEETPPLDEVRRALASGQIDADWLLIERLTAEKARPFHGIIFEGNEPHARVQIRLFGKLAFRVHFLRLAVGGPRAQYTHDLAKNEEHVRLVARNQGE